MVFNGIVKGKVLEIYAQNVYKRFLEKLEGKQVVVAIKKKESQRSPQQNRYYWFALGILEKETGNDKDDLHEYFKELLLSMRKDVIFSEVKQSFIVVPSTARLTVREFKDYLDKVIRWCAEHWYVIPSPDEAETTNYDVSYWYR